MNNFKCPHCDKFHKDGHPKTGANWNKFREQRDALRRENNSLRKHAYFNLPRYTKEQELGPPTQSSELIVGYRVWRYSEGYLRSTFKTDVIWPHRKALTRDIYDDMGIHACKEYKKVLSLLSEYCSNMEKSLGVAGSIYMWGEVKEHETGYLSEFAYPKEFFVGDDWDPITAMQLEENYGVPVIFREELNKDCWPKHVIRDWGWSKNYFSLSYSIVDWAKFVKTPVKQNALAKDDPALRQASQQPGMRTATGAAMMFRDVQQKMSKQEGSD